MLKRLRNPRCSHQPELRPGPSQPPNVHPALFRQQRPLPALPPNNRRRRPSNPPPGPPPLILHPHFSPTPPIATGGANHSILITPTGDLHTCGINDHSQLGHGPASPPYPSFTLVALATPTRFVAAACGWDHTLLVCDESRVWGFGSDEEGQIAGSGGEGVPTIIEGITGRVQRIGCGLRHSIAIGDVGEVWGWGGNRHGELGAAGVLGEPRRGRATRAVVPTPTVLPLPPTLAVACGQHHTILLTQSGRILAFGRNRFGQLGTDPSLLPRSSAPIEIRLPPHAGRPIHVFSGWSHAGVICSSGHVFLWGRNDHGQLGTLQESIAVGGRRDSPVAMCYTPVELKSLHGARSIVCGSEHALAVGADGGCWAWGWNEHGNCGVGGTEDVLEPRLVRDASVNGRVRVGCGYGHSFLVNVIGEETVPS
ncbi:regulator of chromosome condensation 1/beta-lactamase-inhibitor protein II [Blyttiomyces helicus]|uniref:Regulator of chromosome condensation 1/beta-lactamase-inhibitor protein II n=1 Tax=Blyttiomyces helicus TaxID=388810 RepID=A0A4P9WAW0_9FUNG|nr:regulator of chromosome condensation 1/beta-lactamase-inhibitor protein II [Blyttiomyces helicus]|eukprot:RKO87386.1 regulator of chromosome condensation 1/beta-lactamase-inhibitor protein II [Blyttiomyces helicus]